jgi:hypothetical protein
MQNRIAQLKHEDLVSGVSLKNWLKENLHAYTNKDVPDEHLLIYVDYIEGKVRENDSIDKRIWLKTIGELKERIEAVSVR